MTCGHGSSPRGQETPSSCLSQPQAATRAGTRRRRPGATAPRRPHLLDELPALWRLLVLELALDARHAGCWGAPIGRRGAACVDATGPGREDRGGSGSATFLRHSGSGAGRCHGPCGLCSAPERSSADERAPARAPSWPSLSGQKRLCAVVVLRTLQSAERVVSRSPGASPRCARSLAGSLAAARTRTSAMAPAAAPAAETGQNAEGDVGGSRGVLFRALRSLLHVEADATRFVVSFPASGEADTGVLASASAQVGFGAPGCTPGHQELPQRRRAADGWQRPARSD